MAETPSTMVALGTTLPRFSLRNVIDGKTVSSYDFAGSKALLVMFICNHCPYVRHVRAELLRLVSDYAGTGLDVVAINSNDQQAYPQDGPDEMRKLARGEKWEFPFLFDDTQNVAKVFQAACTPDFFVYDRKQKLAYRGQLDDSRPGNDRPVTGRDLRAAIDAVLAGAGVSEEQVPSVGCNIKWKPGNQPT